MQVPVLLKYIQVQRIPRHQVVAAVCNADFRGEAFVGVP